MDYGLGINRSDLAASRLFGFQVTCYSFNCLPPPISELVDVRGIDLEAVDSTPPSLAAPGTTNVWHQAGHYIRGTWASSFIANDDSGVCGMYEIVDGQTIIGPVDPGRDQGSWTQCPSPLTMNLSLDTSLYPDGPLSLNLGAWDAPNPANTATAAETLAVDNQPVRLTLSGPSDAPSTAGVQYVTADAAAGPSGVGGIACSVDGAPYAWQPVSRAEIPIQGVGQHRVLCYAQNNAFDVHGEPNRSAIADWTVGIRVPTLISASFAHTVDALRCVHRTERVRVPAHWVTVRQHGRPVQVRVPASVRRVRVTRCHPRIIIRRVRVNGHWRVIREPVFPHQVNRAVERVRFGRAASVSGWLGLSNGIALSGRTIHILEAPEDGSNHFTTLTTATTSANGSWAAHVPPGPSRFIEAVYGGGATEEPAYSADVRLDVPARLRMYVRPRRVPWGSRIVIGGRVLGGYIPADLSAVSQLLRLRIGVQGVSETVGIPDVRRDGRFRTSYCFNPGRGAARFWFSVSTLKETDYPFLPASSRRSYVVVGPGSKFHPC